MTTTLSPSEEIESWVRLAIEGAEDKLAARPKAFFVGEVLGITDWFVIVSGASSRQVRAIVEGVEEMVFLGDGPKPIRIEGLNAPDWVLMDYGSFLVHVFTEEAREYYDLERLWSDVPQLTADGITQPDAASSKADDTDSADAASEDTDGAESEL